LTFGLVAEAQDLKDRVTLAIQAGYSMISIEGDNTAVIRALKGESKGPWQISHIIEDVRACFHQDIQVFINHIFREANMAADWLSKFGHSITETFTIDFCFSPILRQMIADDCIGRTLVRTDD